MAHLVSEEYLKKYNIDGRSNVDIDICFKK